MEDYTENIKSEEFEEILTKIPHWITRAGISVIFFIICILFTATLYIRYPEVVSAPVTVTSQNPPLAILAKFNTRISKYFVKEGDIVHKNSLLAVMESGAEYDDVLALKLAIDKLRPFADKPKSWLLNDIPNVSLSGELDKNYNLLRKYYSQYKSSKNDKLIPIIIFSIDEMIMALDAWEQKYLIRSPSDGKVHITDLSGSNGILSENSEICTISPGNPGGYIGRIYISPSEIQKIKIGQMARIQLFDYPEIYSSSFEGNVESVSFNKNNKNYLVCLKITNTGISEFKNDLQGNAEIITQDISLSERIFGRYLDLFKFSKAKK